MDYERLFLEQLGLVEQTVRFIGRRHHLSAEELEELSSTVRLKLIENDYEVLRKYEGRSSLRTYLTAVIHRHFLDARIARWGKWRPCAQARKLGPEAMLLDRLLTRDGLSFTEAVEVLRTNHGVRLTEAEIYDLSAQLPSRASRRFVGEEQLGDAAVPAQASGTPLELAELQAEAGQVEQALSAVLERLPSEDRLILKLRFQENFQISQIARLLRLEQKPLYRRLEQLMLSLRRELEARGVRSDRVARLLHDANVELQPVLGAGAGEDTAERRSTP